MKTPRLTLLSSLLAFFVLGCAAPTAAPLPSGMSEENFIRAIAGTQTAAAAQTKAVNADFIATLGAVQTAALAETLTAAPPPSPTLIVTLVPAATRVEILAPTTTPTPMPPPFILPPEPDASLTQAARPLPRDWRGWEIAPELSRAAIQIVAKGLLLGNNPKSFSKIGDCQSAPGVFLGVYATEDWLLPEEYQAASASIEHYRGFFEIANVTAKNGYEVTNMFDPLFADPKLCQPTETPLACELRLRRPIVALIALGTNWGHGNGSPEKFEKYLRQIVDALIEKGSLPILVNKPDNTEKNGSLNLAMAQVAYDYDLPLINIWKALDPLPGHGLKAGGIYMSPKSWSRRNTYALVMLDKVRQVVAALGY